MSESQVVVLSIYSHRVEKYSHFFIKTTLNPRQLCIIVENRIRKTVRSGRNTVIIFGQTFTQHDLLADETINDWENCKSINSYKEFLANRVEVQDIVVACYLDDFVVDNTVNFEDYETDAAESLKDAMINKLSKNIEFSTMLEQNVLPNDNKMAEIVEEIMMEFV